MTNSYSIVLLVVKKVIMTMVMELKITKNPQNDKKMKPRMKLMMHNKTKCSKKKSGMPLFVCFIVQY